MNTKTRFILALCSNIIEVTAIVLAVKIALPYFGINIPVYGLVLIIFSWLLMSVVIYRIGSRALDRKVASGFPSMAGTRGVVVKELSPKGTVRIQGEYWQAISEQPVALGNEVEVISQRGMLLSVRPITRQV